MQAELIDRMGTDLTVVNAARVSFEKEIQDLAIQWDGIISAIPELKYSWRALTRKEEHGPQSKNSI